jgi:hypothetical protein
MNAKLLLTATLAGAFTLYAWESLSNAVLPWHRETMRSFADSNAVVQAMKAQAPVNGLYVDARGIVAAVSLQPDLADRSSLLGPMLGKQLGIDFIVALVFLLAMQRLPRMTTIQYMAAFAVAAFAISLSTFTSNAVWWGYPAAWTLVQVLDRTIGFALMGLAMGATFNKWSPRVTTDEWGGVRVSGGLPSSMSGRGART